MNEEIVKTVYTILKQYLPQKDMQQACDHLVDDLQEVLDKEELYRLAGLDKYMKASVHDILGEPEEDFDYEDEDYWSQWYNRVVNNIAEIPQFIGYYESELEEAKYECGVKGIVEKNISALPGITEHRFNQLQEIEAVLNFLNIQLRKIRRKHFQKNIWKDMLVR